MSSISDSTAGQSFANQASQLSVSSRQSMDAGLTIQTREGDVVTLSTSQYSELSASMSQSRQSVSSENGSASASLTQREIQLSSGQAFSFSVQGDLSEEELADIDSILSGVDGIISDMTAGDMNGALAQALSMGSYDSISGYEADISVTRSYSAMAAYSATSLGNANGNGNGLPGIGNQLKASGLSDLAKQLGDFLDQQKETSLAQAQNPLSQLFDHYLEQMEELKASQQEAPAADEEALAAASAPEEAAAETKAPEDAEETGRQAMESLAKTVDDMIQERVKNLFSNTLDQMA